MSQINREYAPDEKRWVVSLVKLDSDRLSNRCLFCIEGVENGMSFLHAYLISHKPNSDSGNFGQLLIQRRDSGNGPVIGIMPSLSYYAEAAHIKNKLYSSIDNDMRLFNDQVNAACEFALTPGEHTKRIEKTLKDHFLARWCEDKVSLVVNQQEVEDKLTPTPTQSQQSTTLTSTSSKKPTPPEEPEEKSCCCITM